MVSYYVASLLHSGYMSNSYSVTWLVHSDTPLMLSALINERMKKPTSYHLYYGTGRLLSIEFISSLI